jgi:phosphopantetheinyl transferase
LPAQSKTMPLIKVEQQKPDVPGLAIIERRSSSRPRFIESWRKTITPSWAPTAQERGANERCRIEVWIARTEALLRAQSSHNILTEDDWTSILRLRAVAGRNSAMASKILLRLGLSQAVNYRVAPDEWRFQRTIHGKPMVTDSFPDINFSVSHVDALTIVAVSSTLNLGIDVETIDQHLNRSVVSGFCHANEQCALEGLPQHQMEREFIRLWTQKEAYTKLIGLGHSVEFSSINCLPEPIEAALPTNAVSPTHFENFFVPVDHSLYHASLSIEPSKLNIAAVDVQLINVVGPDSIKNASPVPVSP